MTDLSNGLPAEFPPGHPLSVIAAELGPWQDHNFPGWRDTPYRLLLGVTEEVGELAHAHLKGEQGIRGTAEEHEAAARDAVGDTIVYLTAYCEARGWNVVDVLRTTWDEVRRRDFRRSPADGVSGGGDTT
jgi:NTP pyrophosphatase (non-canonical NTP hydrolase)